MLESGFRIKECDKRIYVKDTENDYVILYLYVDDMLIVGSNDKMIKFTKNMLNSRLDMKDIDPVNVIFRVKITRTSYGFILS